MLLFGLGVGVGFIVPIFNKGVHVFKNYLGAWEYQGKRRQLDHNNISHMVWALFDMDMPSYLSEASKYFIFEAICRSGFGTHDYSSIEHSLSREVLLCDWPPVLPVLIQLLCLRWIITYLLAWSNPIYPNRRSFVQWHFPVIEYPLIHVMHNSVHIKLACQISGRDGDGVVITLAKGNRQKRNHRSLSKYKVDLVN